MIAAEALYVAEPASRQFVDLAMHDTLNCFDKIRSNALKDELQLDIRPLVAVVVALQPYTSEATPDNKAILTIGKIGQIPTTELSELFTLKAVSRAFAQRKRGLATDTATMERLAWLDRNELHMAASASKNGIHVGFAGGWPHHSRIMAGQFASTIAKSLDLEEVDEPKSVSLEDEFVRETLSWLNMGHGAGDGGLAELNDSRWSRARLAIDSLAL